MVVGSLVVDVGTLTEDCWRGGRGRSKWLLLVH